VSPTPAIVWELELRPSSPATKGPPLRTREVRERERRERERKEQNLGKFKYQLVCLSGGWAVFWLLSEGIFKGILVGI
jgi:hypothetical protein